MSQISQLTYDEYINRIDSASFQSASTSVEVAQLVSESAEAAGFHVPLVIKSAIFAEDKIILIQKFEYTK